VSEEGLSTLMGITRRESLAMRYPGRFDSHHSLIYYA